MQTASIRPILLKISIDNYLHSLTKSFILTIDMTNKGMVVY